MFQYSYYDNRVFILYNFFLSLVHIFIMLLAPVGVLDLIVLSSSINTTYVNNMPKINRN